MRDRQYPLSELNSQTLPCLLLDRVPANECPYQPDSNFYFKRTLLPIPNYIGKIRSVNTGTMSTNYDYVEWDKFKYKLSSRFQTERDKPYWSFKRGKFNDKEGIYIYLYNDQFTESVSLTTVFSDPLEAFQFPSCDQAEKCFNPLEKEFIVDQQLIPLILDLSLQQLMRGKIQVSDILNNNQDDASNTKIPLK